MSEQAHSIKAHAHNHLARLYPPVWREQQPPSGVDFSTGSLRHCSFCGSMHPAELAAAIRAGAKVSWADRKYGWPHKIYVEGIPNPHAGLPEINSAQYCSSPPQAEIDAGKWERYQDGFDSRTGAPKFSYRILGAARPAPALTHGKFYSEHLQDAAPDDLTVIERAMGLHFVFGADGSVAWSPST